VRVDGDVVLFEESAGPACGGFAGEAGPGVLALDEQVDLEAHLGEGGGEFEAEESGADDGGAAPVGGCAARVASAFGFGFVDGVVEALEVVEGAEVVEAGEIVAGEGEVFGGCAGGEEQL